MPAWDRPPALPELEEGSAPSPTTSGYAAASRGSGSGAKPGWWKDIESVEVALIPEKEGWFLTKYRVESNVRPGGGPRERNAAG